MVPAKNKSAFFYFGFYQFAPYLDGKLVLKCNTAVSIPAIHQTKGRNYMQMWWNYFHNT